MPTIEMYISGDQIATFTELSSSGNSNGVKLVLTGVQTLGPASTYFRVVIRQVNEGQTAFSNGQFVDIYAWPDDDQTTPPIFSSLNPQHDQYQGRASSAGHQIITSPANILIQTTPIIPGTVQIGPGIDPPREEQLSFNAFLPNPPTVPCFVKGTLIRTARGNVPVEDIRPDDRVQTADNGLRPVVWTGRRKVCGLGSMAPIRFEAGSLGNRRTLLVSPQHRMLISGWQPQLLTGETELLAAAAHLVNGRTIRAVRRPMVTYVHLMCDDHEVLFAEGAPSESLFAGGRALSAFDRAARHEIRRLFPHICPQKGTGTGMARPVLPRATARIAFA
ncbi:MAG: Hint domain-containing protein [Paracoccaceae bacterium]